VTALKKKNGKKKKPGNNKIKGTNQSGHKRTCPGEVEKKTKNKKEKGTPINPKTLTRVQKSNVGKVIGQQQNEGKNGPDLRSAQRKNKRHLGGCTRPYFSKGGGWTKKKNLV